MFGFLGLLGFGWWRFSTGLSLLNASNSGGMAEPKLLAPKFGLPQPSVGLNCSDRPYWLLTLPDVFRC